MCKILEIKSARHSSGWVDEIKLGSKRVWPTSFGATATDMQNIPISGGSGTITITGNDRWGIVAPDWITLSQTLGHGGATISVAVGANSGDRRQGSIVITSGHFGTRSFVVSQTGYNIAFIPAGQMAFVPVGESKGLAVVADEAWTVGTVPAWISLSRTSGPAGTTQITVTAAPNTGLSRTGQIQFISAHVTRYYNVYQQEDAEYIVQINDDICICCGSCEEYTGCPTGAWRFDVGESRPFIDPARCVGCGDCIERVPCPTEALVWRKKEQENE